MLAVSHKSNILYKSVTGQEGEHYIGSSKTKPKIATVVAINEMNLKIE